MRDRRDICSVQRLPKEFKVLDCNPFCHIQNNTSWCIPKCAFLYLHSQQYDILFQGHR